MTDQETNGALGGRTGRTVPRSPTQTCHTISVVNSSNPVSKIVLLLASSGIEKRFLTLTLPLVARITFTSILNTTCSHITSALWLKQPLPCQAPSTSSPSLHGRTPTSPLRLPVCYFHQPKLIYSLLAKRSPSSPLTPLGSKHLLREPNSQNCTYEASPHTMTLTLCTWNILPHPHKIHFYLSLRYIIRASNRTIFSVSTLALTHFCYKKCGAH